MFGGQTDREGRPLHPYFNDVLPQIFELLQSGAAVVILAVNLADTFTLADRLVRVQRGATCEVYERSEFDRLPFCAPWLNLYKTQ